MNFAFLLGAIICASPLTFLRGTASIGPVDVVMAGVSVLTFLYFAIRLNGAKRQGALATRDEERFWRTPAVLFWVVCTPLLVGSLFVNIQTGIFANIPIFQSIAPFILTAVVTWAAALSLTAGAERRFFLGFSLVGSVIGLAYLAGIVTGSEIMFVDARFKGLSINPNQTALHALSVIIVSALSLKYASYNGKVEKLVHIFNIVAWFAVGIASSSDAFAIAIIPMLAVGIVVVATRILGRMDTSLFLLGTGALLAVLAFVGIYNDEFNNILADINFALQYGNQDVDRYMVWHNGLLAWEEHPIIGNGPGAWSGFSGPYQGMEAHNTIIDWLSMSGILGGFAYVALLFFLAKGEGISINLRIAAVISVLLFGMFHFVLRMPTLWVALLAIGWFGISRRQNIVKPMP